MALDVTVDVVIPTAHWATRPGGLLRDLARELPRSNLLVGSVMVAEERGVYFVEDQLLGEGPVRFEGTSDHRNGPAINRNKAWPLGHGDWVVFLDDDVRLDHGWGSELGDQVLRTDTPDVAGGQILARQPGNWFAQAAEDFVIRHKKQPDGWYLAAAHLLVRRTALEELNGFDDAFEYGGEDWDLCKRAHMSGVSVGVLDSLRVTHQHPTSFRQLMLKARQYGAAESGLDVYSDPLVTVTVETADVRRSLPQLLDVVKRAGRWPALQYAEFRSIGRSRVRSLRSTALYVPWMASYLKNRR